MTPFATRDMPPASSDPGDARGRTKAEKGRKPLRSPSLLVSGHLLRRVAEGWQAMPVNASPATPGGPRFRAAVPVRLRDVALVSRTPDAGLLVGIWDRDVAGEGATRTLLAQFEQLVAGTASEAAQLRAWPQDRKIVGELHPANVLAPAVRPHHGRADVDARVDAERRPLAFDTYLHRLGCKTGTAAHLQRGRLARCQLGGAELGAGDVADRKRAAFRVNGGIAEVV